MTTLKTWMSERTAKKRRGPKITGLSYAEAALWLSNALKRRITKAVVYDWCKGRTRIPQDVLDYIVLDYIGY